MRASINLKNGWLMKNFNKIVALTLLGTAVFGINYANASANSPASTGFNPFLYVGGQLGWANSDWSGFTNLPSADDTGVVYGAKMGYQASRRFGVEVGGFILPNSDQSTNPILLPDGSTITESGTVKSWVGYGAATFRMPIFGMENFYLRGKVGAAYRNLDHDGNLYTGVGDGNYWTAILGASLNYAFANTSTLPIILGIEYSNILGSGDWTSNGSINNNTAPSVQIIAATLSVAFKV
jgi:outer membrane protein with beta-barrel domain